MNPVGYTWAYRTGTYSPLFLPPAPPRNWVLHAFLPFVAFPFPTTSSASPKPGQAFPAPFHLLPALMAWQGQLVYRAATVPVGAFHALSSLKWKVLKLCSPTLPTSSTPLKLPLQLSCPSLSAHCSLGNWPGVLRLEGALWLSLGGKVGGREGAVPCCRWGRLLVQAALVGPAAAHQTCSLAFPHPKELVLVLPETSLPCASVLEFLFSLYSWGVAPLRVTMGLSGDQCHAFFASQRLS